MITEFDLEILNFIQTHLKCDFLDAIMPVITALGNSGIFWIILSVLFIVKPRTRRMGFQMLCAMSLGFLVGNMGLKLLIGRERPFTINTDIVLLITQPTDYSFPSGHTLVSFEAAITMFFYNKKWGIAALVLASLIAFSRMYLYVHFPSDILGGVLLAMAISFLMKMIFDKYVPVKNKWMHTAR